MNQVALLAFDDTDIHAPLDELDDAELDQLEFGVIGFDGGTVVRRYNALESRLAGLMPARVLGSELFRVVAPCMNNFLVAQRFEDAAAANQPLDTVIPYVLTLRMRPVKVALRCLSSPEHAMRYVLVDRRP